MKELNRHVSNEMLQMLSDGELGEEDARKLRMHFEECASCRGAYAEVQSLDRMLGSIPLEKTSPELTERVMTSLPHHARRLSSSLGKFPYLLGAAFVLTVSGMGLLASFLIAHSNGVTKDWGRSSTISQITKEILEVSTSFSVSIKLNIIGFLSGDQIIFAAMIGGVLALFALVDRVVQNRLVR